MRKKEKEDRLILYSEYYRTGKMNFRKQKKSIVCFLIFSLIVSILDIHNTKAYTSVLVQGESIQAMAGEYITVPVTIKNNTGIMGFLVSITYDEDALKPMGVEKGQMLQGVFDSNYDTSEKNCFDVLWAGNENNTNDGQIFSLKFKVLESANSGKSIVQIGYSQSDTFDENYNDVELNCSNFEIDIDGSNLAEDQLSPLPTIIETEKPTRQPDIAYCAVTADEVNADSESEVCVPVRITNNPGIVGFVMNINYDKEYLKPLSVVQGSVLSAGTVFQDNISSATGGTFKVMWSGTENMVENGELFTIHFMVKKCLQDRKLNVGLDYVQKDTFNERYEAVGMECVSGTIYVNAKTPIQPTATSTEDTTEQPVKTMPVSTPTQSVATSTVESTVKSTIKSTIKPTINPTIESTIKPSIPNTSKCKIVVDKVSAESESEIDMVVRIKDNPGIAGFVINVSYDDKYLTPISITKGSILASGTVFTNNISAATKNTFKVLWAGEQNFTESGILFTVRFRVGKCSEDKELSVKFDSEANNTFNEDFEAVEMIGALTTINVTVAKEVAPIAKPPENSNLQSIEKGKSSPTATPSKKSVVRAPDKIKKVKVKAQGKGKAKISWTWLFNIMKKGNYGYPATAIKYEVQYATNKSLKKCKKKIYNWKTKSAVIKKLKKKKKYYFRVRAFVKVGGKTYRGAWSSKKKIKVK